MYSIEKKAIFHFLQFPLELFLCKCGSLSCMIEAIAAADLVMQGGQITATIILA